MQNTDMGNLCQQMENNILGTSSRGQNQGQEGINGRMVTFMKVNLNQTKEMDVDFINGQMEVHTEGNGEGIECMESVEL